MSNTVLKKYILGYITELGVKKPVLIDRDRTKACLETHQGRMIVLYNHVHFFYITTETRMSDNLIDLIDTGDLVFNNLTNTIREVLKVDGSVYVETVKNKSEYMASTSINIDDIQRIYKIDDDGNYVLVYKAAGIVTLQ